MNKVARKTKAPQYDSFKLRGYLEYMLRDAQTGEIVSRGRQDNVVTAAGRGMALGKMTTTSNSTAQVITAMAIGTSSTVASSNDTGLPGFATLKTFNVGTTLTSATNTACTFQCAASWASNETWTNSSRIGEFALIMGTTSNAYTAFNHITTNSYINFDTSNTLAITITITN